MLLQVAQRCCSQSWQYTVAGEFSSFSWHAPQIAPSWEVTFCSSTSRFARLLVGRQSNPRPLTVKAAEQVGQEVLDWTGAFWLLQCLDRHFAQKECKQGNSLGSENGSLHK